MDNDKNFCGDCGAPVGARETIEKMREVLKAVLTEDRETDGLTSYMRDRILAVL